MRKTMQKTPLDWTVNDLIKNIDLIEYPEFQREPTVWKLGKKQKLIDSILRDFDISTIYFYKKEDGGYDCIDGQQRINAILSYIGINGNDTDDNRFHLKITNEIYDDEGKFSDVDNKRYENLENHWKTKIDDYTLNIVLIEKIDNDEELNLLFLRLQIASVLNAGEKLNAMTGEMRDWVFHYLSRHDFFAKIRIPIRRYAREQVAAQIVNNIFGLRDQGIYQRSRYVDLQNFFKKYSNFDSEDIGLTENIFERLNIIVEYMNDTLQFIKNRAIAVSFFLFVYQIVDITKNNKDLRIELNTFAKFFGLFLKTLKWQIPKGVQMNSAYYDLLNFQNYVTQAAVEKTAIEKRHDLWRRYFDHYKKKKEIIGDSEYKKNTGKDPNEERDMICPELEKPLQ
jgi:hypothetical protein